MYVSTLDFNFNVEFPLVLSREDMYHAFNKALVFELNPGQDRIGQDRIG